MKFIEINKEEFKAKQENQELFIIDVREEYEFEESNIGGINIPMAQVLSRTAEFDNQNEIYLCCASGKRSKTVAYHLAEQLADTTIYSLNGGIKEYLGLN